MTEYDSRIEKILQDTIDGELYTDVPLSPNEALLIELNKKIVGTKLSEIDLNDVMISGFYSGDNCSNCPFSKFTLLVIGYSDKYASQICIDLATGAVKTRSDINGTWSAWTSLSGSALLIDSDENYISTNNDDRLRTD